MANRNLINALTNRKKSMRSKLEEGEKIFDTRQCEGFVMSTLQLMKKIMLNVNNPEFLDLTFLDLLKGQPIIIHNVAKNLYLATLINFISLEIEYMYADPQFKVDYLIDNLDVSDILDAGEGLNKEDVKKYCGQLDVHFHTTKKWLQRIDSILL